MPRNRIPAWLFLLGAASWYLAANLIRIQSGLALPSDFGRYYDAARHILNGASPYSDPVFIYPAIVAFLAAPFGLTTYLTSRWIWFIASHLLLLGAGLVTWRFLGRRMLAACCVGLVWALGGAASESLALGQIGPLLSFLLALAYTSTGSTQGMAAGIGAGLKLLPGVLAFPIGLSRQWRALVSLASSAALLIVVPTLALRWFSGPRAPEHTSFLLGTPAILSWSIPSTLLRAMDPPMSSGALPHNWEFGNEATSLNLAGDQRIASVVSSLVILAAGALLLAWRTRGRIAAEKLPVAMAGFLSLALAAAPVCWSHYQVLQYPGVALMLGVAAQRRHWGLAAAIILCGSLLYPVPVAVLGRYYHRYGWTAASPWQLHVWTSAAPVACVGLFGISLKLT